MKTIIAIGALLLLVNPAFAGNKELDRKQIYELKERCHQAAGPFVKEMTNPDALLNMDVKSFSSSQNYNRRLNTCLVQIVYTHTDGRKDINVLDVLTNKSMAYCPAMGDSYEEGKLVSRDECIMRAYQLMNE